MALLFTNDPFDGCHRPSYPVEDFLSAVIPGALDAILGSPYLRQSSTIAPKDRTTVNFDKDKFQANLDVQQFKPEEITVKVTGDNTVTVEGKHEEKRDEHGYISRHFVRRYVLPEGHDVNKIESRLSSDGVLTITAPKVDAKLEEGRSIPITRTGQPSKPVVNKKEEEK